MIRRTKDRRSRRGAAILESALVMPIFLIGAFSLLDLAIMSLRQNAISTSAIQLSRMVAISELTEWSGSHPDEFVTTLDKLQEEGIEDPLITPLLDSKQVVIKIKSSEDALISGSRIYVTCEYTHRSLVGFLLPWSNTRLEATAQATLLN